MSQVLIDVKAIWEDHILNQVVKTGGQQEQSGAGLDVSEAQEFRDREKGRQNGHAETKGAGVSRGMWLCRSPECWEY